MLAVGAADLNVPVSCDNGTSVRQMVRRALSLGYQTVVLNTEINQDEVLTKKQLKTKGNKKLQAGGDKARQFPEPYVLELAEEDYPLLAGQGRKPVVLNRLTLTVKNNDFIPHFAKSDEAKKYDLVAVLPASTQVLVSLLKSPFRFDIMTFRPDDVQSVNWTRKLYNECVERNVYFEITYADAVRDTNDRRRMISQAHKFHAVGKSKNVFFSSRALSPIELRAPHDVANLAFVFGLTESQGKRAVSGTCEAVTRAAAGRKMGPFRLRIEKVEQSQQSEPEPAEDMDTG